MVPAVVLLLIAYLIGSIPFPIIVSRFVLGIDLREHGSGNMGALNAGRVLGKRWFPLVMGLDLGKGFFAAWLAMAFIPGNLAVSPTVAAAFGGLFAVLGHCFPVFAGFKGGVGLASTGGALLVISPYLFAAVGLSVLLFWSLLRNMYVGVAITALLFPVLGWLMFGEPWATAGMAVWGAVVFALHWKDVKAWAAARRGG